MASIIDNRPHSFLGSLPHDELERCLRYNEIDDSTSPLAKNAWHFPEEGKCFFHSIALDSTELELVGGSRNTPIKVI
jgi:hypothetical protein